jgi:hypothetical protein
MPCIPPGHITSGTQKYIRISACRLRKRLFATARPDTVTKMFDALHVVAINRSLASLTVAAINRGLASLTVGTKSYIRKNLTVGGTREIRMGVYMSPPKKVGFTPTCHRHLNRTSGNAYRTDIFGIGIPHGLDALTFLHTNTLSYLVLPIYHR